MNTSRHQCGSLDLMHHFLLGSSKRCVGIQFSAEMRHLLQSMRASGHCQVPDTQQCLAPGTVRVVQSRGRTWFCGAHSVQPSVWLLASQKSQNQTLCAHSASPYLVACTHPAHSQTASCTPEAEGEIQRHSCCLQDIGCVAAPKNSISCKFMQLLVQ